MHVQRLTRLRKYDRLGQHRLGVRVGGGPVDIGQYPPELRQQPGPARCDPSDGDAGLDKQQRTQFA